MPYSYFESLQGFFIVHSIIGSTVHSILLNSLEHCICTTTNTAYTMTRCYYYFCYRLLISQPGEWVNIALRRFLHNHGNIATKQSPKPELCPTPLHYFEWLQGYFIVHGIIGSTVHSVPLNRLHCICTTTMQYIRPDRDSGGPPNAVITLTSAQWILFAGYVTRVSGTHKRSRVRTPLKPSSFKETKRFFSIVMIQCCREPLWPRGSVFCLRPSEKREEQWLNIKLRLFQPVHFHGSMLVS